MKHKFQSAKSDGADGTQVQASHWNAAHVCGTAALSANTTIDATYDTVLGTGGAGGITITLPTAVSNAGMVFTIFKVDSAAGAVTVDANASETINGDLTYALKNQFEMIEIESDGSNWLIKDIRTGFSIASTTVLASGSGTYTVPAGVKAIMVECVAAGGGGGGVTGAASSVGAGGGGGSGSYAKKLILAPSATYAYAVGAAGTAGANTGGTGGTGGATTFGSSLITCNGGVGGVGQTTGTTLVVVAGGAGGAVSTGGDLNIPGGSGGFGYRASGTFGWSGSGASSQYGSGGGSVLAAGAGVAGGVYGSGGSGGLSTANTARAGGAGSSGLIIITEYK
jgi:hypothetical protein